ncbi:M48 family metallopeptidase [Roseovarius sp. SCSIO 43702]|uniref:M48 family metallopeptidase n=1 Tax=Roseovarius sp. SCSIO 43702 TaxID=2823043 RepID=UPI001C730194|nr:SprT family zinc-dependent metalloprotease [Roseovarius sp. SCSIO 43702]QYX57317.1 M48 family metallopeptidase [Roseovarius sp. SCSIO 43702]
MGQHRLMGNPPIDVTVRRSARARRISLRVSGIDGRVSLTLPRGVTETEGLEFARSKTEWLRRHLDQRPDAIAVEIGAQVPVEGRIRTLAHGSGRKVAIGADTIEVPGPPDRAGVRLAAWLRTLARERLADASDRHAAALGRGYVGLTLRDSKSRWGSCSSRGGLNYSWRLILAPPEVLDYVAAHEVAHLAEMNHSRAFWAHVARLCPDYERPRGWLRAHGAGLHRYRFES